MKLVVLVLCLGFFSAFLAAHDLQSLAKRERARRAALRSRSSASGPSKSFTDTDLEAYKTVSRHEPRPPRHDSQSRSSLRPPRDLAKEKAYWRRQKLQNDGELARLDARIRKLVWRLREHRAKRREKGILGDDPTTSLLEESIESLREERVDRVTDFHERARKARAFPGWIR